MSTNQLLQLTSISLEDMVAPQTRVTTFYIQTTQRCVDVLKYITTVTNIADKRLKIVAKHTISPV
jgi:hypothetical protein